MNTDLHTQFAKLDREFLKNTGKLEIRSFHNEVIGPCLRVKINTSEGSLLVYGNNDGHRGQGWIHYNKKVEDDLLEILNAELRQKEDDDKERDLNRKYAEVDKMAKVSRILSAY